MLAASQLNGGHDCTVLLACSRKNGGGALQKYFSYRQSCYGRNMSAERGRALTATKDEKCSDYLIRFRSRDTDNGFDRENV
jgi:hypothetical protein